MVYEIPAGACNIRPMRARQTSTVVDIIHRQWSVVSQPGSDMVRLVSARSIHRFIMP